MALSIGDLIIGPEKNKTYKILKTSLTFTGFCYWLGLLGTETGVVHTTTVVL